jgi:CheY-like chemotaxis protein
LFLLSPILVQTELAKLNLPQDHAVQENLDEVLKAGHRAADLVKHILTFSRQEKQKHVIFDMRGTVKEVLKLIRATIPSSIEIVQRISAEPATIMGDPTGIHEVLMNLCSNAAQAMDEMGSVLQVELREVELDREFVKELPGVSPGAFVRLSVSDTGHGIPREVIGRIFDPYFTTKEVGKGTGMGLAVAHGVVREHGGAITVYSEPGQGTTFHVLFPKVQGEVIEAAGASKGIQTGTERILFVDDEEAIIRSGSQMLELLGYEVRSTTVPVEALEMFRAEPNEFDLVITDMTMPHMTGEVLAREMMDIRPDIPIILCTGFSYRIDEQKAKDIGIKGWIMKPFIMRETADMIRNVLGG